MGIAASDSRPDTRALDVRPPVRLDPEILKAIDGREEGAEYYYNESLRPSDMTYEWKRLTYGGKEDTQYQAALSRRGWVAVPAERHPEIGTEASHDSYSKKFNDTIIVNGLILMERHIEYTNRARANSDKLNSQQIGSQKERLQQSEEYSMPRKVTAFKQTYGSGQDIDA